MADDERQRYSAGALVPNIPSVMEVLSAQSVQLFASPWTGVLQAPLSMEFSRQEHCSGLPFPSPRDHPDAGIGPASVVSPALAGGLFTTVARSCPTLHGPMDCRHQASLSFTISPSLLKLMSIESVMASNHLILCHPLLH